MRAVARLALRIFPTRPAAAGGRIEGTNLKNAASVPKCGRQGFGRAERRLLLRLAWGRELRPLEPEAGFTEQLEMKSFPSNGGDGDHVCRRGVGGWGAGPGPGPGGAGADRGRGTAFA